MAVRDLFWGCPVCRTPGKIRKAGRRERCLQCGTTFWRGRAATIVARSATGEQVRSAGEWLRTLGPVQVPSPNAEGLVVGPEIVRIKTTIGQRPLHFGGTFLGWIEKYGATRTGKLELRRDRLHFRATSDETEHWAIDRITGLQPASSTIQIGFRDHMTSVKFVEGSVRLWTQALSDAIHAHYRSTGFEVIELQPHIRACRVVANQA